MKIIALLLVIAASASALEWTNLVVNYRSTLLDPFRMYSYFGLPRSQKEAAKNGWVKLEGANTTRVQMYCMPNDPLVAILLDSYGYICGIQVAVPAADVEKMSGLYDVSKFDLYQNKTMMGKKYVTVTAYTVDPEIIKSGGRPNWGSTTGDEGVWFETHTGYVAIPRFASKLDSAWVKESCIGGMGTHYYYAMNETMACADFHPWSLLYDDGELHGILFQKHGPAKTTNRVWWEQIPGLAIEPTIPNAPKCLTDWTYKYGVTSLHIYFSKRPWKTSC